MARKTENFHDNIISKNYFANNNSKVLGNQNLQLMYDFDFNNHLDAYLCSHNLEKHFCILSKHTPALGTLISQTTEWQTHRLMNIYDHVLLIYINVVDVYECN